MIICYNRLPLGNAEAATNLAVSIQLPVRVSMVSVLLARRETVSCAMGMLRQQHGMRRGEGEKGRKSHRKSLAQSQA